jgi:hypothetical protein
MGHMAAPEPTSTGGRGPELRYAWRRQSSTQQGDEARGHGARGSTGAHLSKEVRFRAAGHVAASEPTSVRRCDLKLQLTWQRVDACLPPCLDLELVCGGTQSSRCRQRPLGPPRERLRTRRWGQFFGAPLSYLIFILGSRRRQRENIDGGPPGGAGAGDPGAPTTNVKTSTVGPREVPELEIRERPPPM